MSEEYVTEYDIDHQETVQGYANPNLGKMNILTGRPKERIIRCRDCAHFHGWDAPEGHYETCDRGLSNNWVGENGFCAWAEPKEEA